MSKYLRAKTHQKTTFDIEVIVHRFLPSRERSELDDVFIQWKRGKHSGTTGHCTETKEGMVWEHSNVIAFPCSLFRRPNHSTFEAKVLHLKLVKNGGKKGTSTVGGLDINIATFATQLESTERAKSFPLSELVDLKKSKKSEVDPVKIQLTLKIHLVGKIESASMEAMSPKSDSSFDDTPQLLRANSFAVHAPRTGRALARTMSAGKLTPPKGSPGNSPPQSPSPSQIQFNPKDTSSVSSSHSVEYLSDPEDALSDDEGIRSPLSKSERAPTPSIASPILVQTPPAKETTRLALRMDWKNKGNMLAASSPGFHSGNSSPTTTTSHSPRSPRRWNSRSSNPLYSEEHSIEQEIRNRLGEEIRNRRSASLENQDEEFPVPVKSPIKALSLRGTRHRRTHSDVSPSRSPGNSPRREHRDLGPISETTELELAPELSDALEKIAEQEKELQKLKLQVSQNADVQLQDEQALIDNAIYFIEPQFCDGTPISAYLIFRSILHWRVFDSTSNPTLERILDAIDKVAYKERANLKLLVYWLMSTATLLHFLKSELNYVSSGNFDENSFQESQSPIQIFEKKLKNLIQKFFTFLSDNAFREIERIGISCILESPESKMSPKGSTEGLIPSLAKFLRVFRENSLSESLTNQFFQQLFYRLNQYWFNTLLSRRDLCRCGNGIYMKMALSEVEEWASRISPALGELARSELSHVKETGDIFMMNKAQLVNVQTRRDICPHLNNRQLSHLLSMYYPDEYDPESVHPGVLASLVYVAVDELELTLPSHLPLDISVGSLPKLNLKNVNNFIPAALFNRDGFGFLKEDSPEGI
eukprot:TRINITY_DN4522_c0_g1_i1.p1 TRINITY_DN4522_c0_g1~~TRINITY_DN4522_c0_g1_i1.p1  ORF type:complete len:817 (+),score=210.20 TRINITY_DN4522_c0_g1_i1:136-2586(+)